MVTAKKMTTEDIGKKAQEIWSRHDAAAYAALYAPSAVVHDPMHPQPMRGRDAVKKSVEEFWKSFPDAQFRYTNAITQGQTGAMEVTISGTHKGAIAGPKGNIPATNKRVELRASATFRWNAEGLITESRRYYDTASIMKQLGVNT